MFDVDYFLNLNDIFYFSSMSVVKFRKVMTVTQSQSNENTEKLMTSHNLNFVYPQPLSITLLYYIYVLVSHNHKVVSFGAFSVYFIPFVLME